MKCGRSAANIKVNRITEAKEPTVYGISRGSRKRAIRRPIEGGGACRRAAASIVNRSEIVSARSAGGFGRVIKLNLRVNARNSTTSARHTGQRSRCSSIATRAGRDTQSSRYNESVCLVSSHDIIIYSISDG